MKKDFYRTIYRLLAGATKRVNWSWLNHWKVVMGVSLIAAGNSATGKGLAPTRVAARFGAQEEVYADTTGTQDSTAEKEPIFCYVAEEMPVFTAGNLSAYIRQHFHYPVEALQESEADATGKVYVQFVIEADGKMTNIKVLRGVHPILDSAAVDFVTHLPEFLPGKLRGKPARVSYTLPLNFTPALREETKRAMEIMCYDVEEFSDPWDALKYYILDHIQYPQEALKQGIKGTVYIELHIGKDGNVSQERIVRGVHPLLDEEALRVAREIPRWKPALVDGKTVDETYVISIPFDPAYISAKPWGEIYIVVEDMPEFPGGNLDAYIAQHLQYPPEAKAQGIEGKVYVQFIVERDGSTNDLRVVRSVHPLLNEEALRLVQEMPHWIPGKQRGKAVRVSQTLPIEFKLD